MRLLLTQGYHVVAVANPLRALKGDADYTTKVLNSIKSPVVLVGHSYGGMVISNAATGIRNVKALVYIDAFAPQAGENAFKLSTVYPGSTLGPALAPIALPGGVSDLYIQQDKYLTQFAPDVPKAEAQWMAATQRPVTDAALNETSGEPAWNTIPSWFIFGDKDLIIPPAVLGFVAERAHSRGTVVVKGASHVVMISHPEEVAKLIVTAATEATAAARTAR